MSFFEKFVKQCGNPTGKFGEFVGRTMNLSHTPNRRWGLSYVDIASDAVILDVGCGGGKGVQDMSRLASSGKVYGIDISEDMVRLASSVNSRGIARGHVEILKNAVSSLPFDDGTFDLITAFENYFFWPDLISDLNEIKRVLKTGGHLFIVNEAYKDAAFEKRNSKWASLLGIEFNTQEELEAILRSAGYRDVVVNVFQKKNWIAAIARK